MLLKARMVTVSWWAECRDGWAMIIIFRNMIMTKEAILAHLYGSMDEPEIKIIDVFVCKLRSKLTKAGLPMVISTVWGRGYSVRDDGSNALYTTPHRQPERTGRVLA